MRRLRHGKREGQVRRSFAAIYWSHLSMSTSNNYPKLHNAAWPGVVGKGGPGAEPPIDLDTMIDLTANAAVNGRKFDGVDLFLSEPHISIDIGDDDLKRWADKLAARDLVFGSVVAPVWEPTGGGPAIDSGAGRQAFLSAVRKACGIAQKLTGWDMRPSGVVRIDSASGVEDWAKDPDGNTATLIDTFRQAADIAGDHGERLSAEGEICWGGMHSWRHMLDVLEGVNDDRLGFQADMAHTLLYTMGYNSPEHSLLPEGFDWSDGSQLDDALRRLTDALRPWTNDFHVAQNDGTVFGSGSHDRTGRHCQATDPKGKLDITRHAGYWLRDSDGELTKACRHICWDGCMFPNAVMMDPQTWNDILAVMVSVQDAHGWSE